LSTITVVCLGDSTTAGTPLFKSPIESPPDGDGDEQSQFGYWLQRAQPEWQVLNRGVNGERSDEIERRFERDVIAHSPRVVVIIAGVNDVYQGRSATEVIARLRAIAWPVRPASASSPAQSFPTTPPPPPRTIRCTRSMPGSPGKLVAIRMCFSSIRDLQSPQLTTRIVSLVHRTVFIQTSTVIDVWRRHSSRPFHGQLRRNLGKGLS
jgi:hypothetical protein